MHHGVPVNVPPKVRTATASSQGSAICDTPMGSFVSIAFAIFVQMVSVMTTSFLMQWSLCQVGFVKNGVTWGLNKVEIKDLQLRYDDHPDVFGNVYSTATAVYWLSMFAMSLGLAAAALAGAAAIGRNNKLWSFSMMALGGDIMMRMVALAVYIAILMPHIKRLPFKKMLDALEKLYPDEKSRWFQLIRKFKNWRASTNHCTKQKTTLGIKGTIAEIVLLSSVFLVLFCCGYPGNKRKQAEDDEKQQAEAQQAREVELTNVPRQETVDQSASAAMEPPMPMMQQPMMQQPMMQQPMMQTDFGVSGAGFAQPPGFSAGGGQVGPLPVQQDYGQGDFGISSSQGGYGY